MAAALTQTAFTHNAFDAPLVEPLSPHRMRLRLGFEMRFQFPRPTPLVAMLSVHYSRFGDLERPDHLITCPNVPLTGYRDSFGNWCTRMVAPAGAFVIGADSVIRDCGAPDPVYPGAIQHEVEDLPSAALPFLLPSRYCESDLLLGEAWARFGHTRPGWERVQAICDFVHGHVAFDYQRALNTRTAAQALEGGAGVCRDYTHLAIALCRALNIPAMYCSGYISDVNQPPPYPPMDFCAWMRVYIGGRWVDFDPRNNRPMTGRVLISTGRDAADTPLTYSFGNGDLTDFRVWIDRIG